MRVRFERPNWEVIRDSGAMAVDMHFHTDYSDSFTDICDALKFAKQRGVGVAIIDHNLIASIIRIKDMDSGVPVVSGMEVNISDGLHILVYFYVVANL